MQLALERLLREEALIISALEDLPVGMFPEMFEEAFNLRFTNILGAMVPAWPFPCLPAGGMFYNPHLETLKALLDGLHVLITGKVHSRSKLRVLDLINVNLDYCNLNAGSHEGDCSPQAMRQQHGPSSRKVPFVYAVEGCMHICNALVFTATRLFKMNLCANGMYFLTGCLEESLRYLSNPMGGLCITDCWLSHSDLDYLSQCLIVCELKHLDLNCVELSDSFPKLLGFSLNKYPENPGVCDTLELEGCNLTDSHFSALLPALTQCSQLTKINFYHNDISLLVLESLLQHTAKMRKLTQELYPTPPECYEDITILRDKLTQLCPELLDILRVERQHKKVSFLQESVLSVISPVSRTTRPDFAFVHM
ncbi:LOW QUALITY PROTEIN: oogenesin-3-like [Phodopus roborovskii]|uniref:LOW QUALITY PROTEIN: oogenesin-3-like n=1 Tax=Phodopus roborovskii TaxID=109678 RepID=UPI0021E4EE3E|nr:LOW QUALITY PROTEIN: oogenesin-3-like [Phodopus roborovskii]